MDHNIFILEDRGFL